jgi:glucose/mannose-6-phosphate isomerase
MLEHIHDFPNMCLQAWQTAKNFRLPLDYSRVNKVAVLGMGGSAIGADLICNLVASEAKVVIITNRDYDLPAFIDNETLVIASSYSGMTEETLHSFEKALLTDSKKLVITTGGSLKSIANREGIPTFCFAYETQPRAALPFSFLSILAFLQQLGFVNDKSGDVLQMIQVLQELSSKIKEDVPLTSNPAKQLAEKIHGRLVVIYGGGILSQVAHRWKTQLNENSKAWAFYEVFPELNHNAVVGYQFPTELGGSIAVVFLRSPSLPRQIQIRYEATRQLLDQAKIGYHIVDSEGNNPLSQMMSVVLFGDYVSYYLAMLYNTDPSPVRSIDYLKRQLKKAQ